MPAGTILKQALRVAVKQAVRVYAEKQVRSFARESAASIARKLVLNPVNAQRAARRFATLDRRMQGKIKWNALRDAQNDYRAAVRKAWKAQPVKQPTGIYRRAIARAQQVKRSGNYLYVGASYKSDPRARVGSLLEWGANGHPGYRVSTRTFESREKRMRRIIAESFMRQVLKSPECSAARREAIKARLND